MTFEKKSAPTVQSKRAGSSPDPHYTRNDLKYGSKPPSNQMGLWGTGSQGEQNYTDAREWSNQHPEAYAYMIQNAYRLYYRHGYVSANYLVNMVRNEMLIAIRNGLAPAFARIIEEDAPDLKGAFTKHTANVDGFVS